MAATNENESAMPTMRISRALISSFESLFSGFMGSVFLIDRWLWWFRSFRVHGQRNYSESGRAGL
jgi:transposase InsO family protein